MFRGDRQAQISSSSVNIKHQEARPNDCDGCTPDLTESLAVSAQRYQANFVAQAAASFLEAKNKYCIERAKQGLCQQANRHAERMALLESRTVRELPANFE